MYEFEKAMRLESLSSIGNEQRGEVQCFLNTIVDMQRVVDEQAMEIWWRT